MENDLYKAFAEVDEILVLMENKYIEKIPQKTREMFKNERSLDYKPEIKVDIPLAEQNLQRKTFAILAMLNLNYWCEDENEKQKLLQVYAKNDKKKEEELRKKYNPDNIFKDKKTQGQKEENTELIEIREENFIKRIIRKIMKFFKK